MFDLRIAEHSRKNGILIVEIMQGEVVVGAIYPTEKGVKIISRYLYHDPKSAIEIEEDKLLPIPAVLVNLIR